jgi:hypothetical protein
MTDEYPDKTLIERLYEIGQIMDDLIMSQGYYSTPSKLDFSLLHDFTSESFIHWQNEINLAHRLMDMKEVADFPHLRQYAQAIALTCPHDGIARQAAKVWMECLFEIDDPCELMRHVAFAENCLPQGSPLQAQAAEYFGSAIQTVDEFEKDRELGSPQL